MRKFTLMTDVASKREYDKIYYHLHKERINEYNKKYYKEHKEQINKQHKRYYQEHKKAIKKYTKKWYEKNRDRLIIQSIKYNKKHRDSCSKSIKKWQSKNPEKVRLYNRKTKNKRKRELGYIELNEKTYGTVGHHIDNNHVLYIPEEIHRQCNHPDRETHRKLVLEKLQSHGCKYNVS